MIKTKDILTNITDQGRTKTWVMKQLGISRRTFYLRVEQNSWTDSELTILRQLNII